MGSISPYSPQQFTRVSFGSDYFWWCSCWGCRKNGPSSIRRSRTRKGILDPGCVLLAIMGTRLTHSLPAPTTPVLTLLLLPLSLISLHIALPLIIHVEACNLFLSFIMENFKHTQIRTEQRSYGHPLLSFSSCQRASHVALFSCPFLGGWGGAWSSESKSWTLWSFKHFFGTNL